MQEPKYRQLSEKLKLMAHPERLRILGVLRGEPECVCHLEALLGKPQPYVSQQLRLLREAGLIVDEKDGLNVFYRLADAEIAGWLDVILGPSQGEDPELARHKQVIACACPKCEPAAQLQHPRSSRPTTARTGAAIQLVDQPPDPERKNHLMKKQVLFLCTGNSARSQMAEAIVNAQLGAEWAAVSAGTQPSGYVHPQAIAALAELGIEHHGRSKTPDEFRAVAFDLVVTVCDDAAENCPVWLGQGKRVHLGFPDPARATGSDEQVLARFREVRDAIARQVPALLRQQTEAAA